MIALFAVFLAVSRAPVVCIWNDRVSSFVVCRKAAVTMMFNGAGEAKAIHDAASGIATTDGTQHSMIAGSPLVVMCHDVVGVYASLCECACPYSARGAAKLPSVDMRQFIVIISSVCKDVPMQRIAAMYRDAYDNDAGGVTLSKFFSVAERCANVTMAVSGCVPGQWIVSVLSCCLVKVEVTLHGCCRPCGVWLVSVCVACASPATSCSLTRCCCLRTSARLARRQCPRRSWRSWPVSSTAASSC